MRPGAGDRHWLTERIHRAQPIRDRPVSAVPVHDQGEQRCHRPAKAVPRHVQRLERVFDVRAVIGIAALSSCSTAHNVARTLR
jgi:hypothetical protein